MPEDPFSRENCMKYGLFPQRLQSTQMKQSFFLPLDGGHSYDWDYRTPKLEVREDYDYDTGEPCMRPFLTVPHSAILLKHINDLDQFLALYRLLSGRAEPWKITYCERCRAKGWEINVPNVWVQCRDCGGYGFMPMEG